MKPLHILAAVLLLLGGIIAMVPQNTTKPYKLTAEQLLSEIKEGTFQLNPEEVADLIIKKDPSIQMIDVRSAKEYEQFNLPGSINIPLENILSPEWAEFLDQGTKMNIFYANGNTLATEAWMITRQLGYENNYILKGGLNYWTEVISNPFPPAQTVSDDEIAKYQFRQGAGMALGTKAEQNVTTPANNTGNNLPKVVPKKKKKGAAGGC